MCGFRKIVSNSRAYLLFIPTISRSLSNDVISDRLSVKAGRMASGC